MASSVQRPFTWYAMSPDPAMPSNPSAAPIRVALVEDDINFASSLSETIRSAPDLQLVSVVSTRAQGLRVLNEVEADVLLVDLGLPDGSGIDVIRAAHLKWPACHIMVCTTFGDEEHVIQSLEAGAVGYLLKDCESLRMLSEIRSIYSGGSPISPMIARKLLTRFHAPNAPATAAAQPTPDKPRAELSARERQVLDFITMGFTADEIATLIAVSSHTVLTYVRRIYAKLEVSSKAEAIYEARKQGLL